MTKYDTKYQWDRLKIVNNNNAGGPIKQSASGLTHLLKKRGMMSTDDEAADTEREISTTGGGIRTASYKTRQIAGNLKKGVSNLAKARGGPDLLQRLRWLGVRAFLRQVRFEAFDIILSPDLVRLSG